MTDLAHLPEGLPQAHGLYDPRHEHDACGIGLIANIHNLKSHQVIADGLPLNGGQGDSFSQLQVPPLDLGQVEIDRGPGDAGATGQRVVATHRHLPAGLTRQRQTLHPSARLVGALSPVNGRLAVGLGRVPGSRWAA